MPPPAAFRPPRLRPLPPCDLPPASFAHGTRIVRTAPRATAWAHRFAPPRSPGAGGGTMASPCCGGGTARPPRCSPPPNSAGGGLAPPVPLPPSRCPGVLRLQVLLAGTWNGWWHTHHRRVEGRIWLSGVEGADGPQSGTMGATLGHALQCRYPQVLFARAPRPDAWGADLPYTWHSYLVPL